MTTAVRDESSTHTVDDTMRALRAVRERTNKTSASVRQTILTQRGAVA
jgi:hypothetical protein